MPDRMKIVWICHFTSSEVQGILRPWRKVSDFAPWISRTIEVFEVRDDLDLHIVSPHEYISGVKEFEMRGVCYHFFNPSIPFWGRHWPGFFRWDVWTNYAKNKRIVQRLVTSITPDVIHLQGAENPYYSATILNLLGREPIVVNLQRINLKALGYGSLRARIEHQILTQAENFTIRTKTMEHEIKQYRPDSKVFWVNYAMSAYKPILMAKEYDIVFFARVGKDKGIEDLIQALGMVHSKIPQAKLCIIGGVNKSYKEYLLRMAQVLGVGKSVTWKGYLPTLDDVHKEASKAKVSVLPTHNDIISGTIIESMQLGLPVVSYKTGSIPELNEDRENVLLSEKGDIEGLADNILKLLTDEELYKTMSQRGIECINERYSNQNVLQQHLDCYREVIADFHKDKQQNLNHREH